MKPAASLLPLLLAVALANMGFMAFNAIIGPLAREFQFAEWHVGVIMMGSGLCWMLSSRPWGRRSDLRGRKAVLTEALSAYTIVFLLLTALVLGRLSSPWPFAVTFAGLLMLRSLLSATFGGMMPVAQAYVADCTTPLQRPSGMATLGFGQAIGMVLGPGAAALLAGDGLLNPFLFGMGCALLAWACLRLLPPSPRDLALTQSRSAQVDDAPTALPLRVSDPRLRLGVTTAFAAMTCVMSAQVSTGFFVQDHFHLSTTQAAAASGKLLVMVGVGLVAAQLLVRKLGWAPLRLIRVGALIAIVGFLQALLVQSTGHAAAQFLIAGFGMGMVFPGFQAAASLAVSPEEQGAAGGAVTFAQACGMVVAPMVSTGLFGFSRFAPFVFSAAVLAVVLVASFTVLPRWHLRPGPRCQTIHP
jgi:MFS transporter, DHA1 family, tetracycline resistance protein